MSESGVDMSESGPCQFCGREKACLVIYVCWFNITWHECVSKDIFFKKDGELIIDGQIPTRATKANIMNLRNGHVIRQSYKRPFPDWTKHELARHIAASSGEFPPSIKPSPKKEKT